jgi:hypothetical protein
MALPPAEKQKAFRERKKAKAKRAPDLVDGYLQTPFSDWFDYQNWRNVIGDLDYVGVTEQIEFPGVGDVDPFWEEEWAEGPNRGSIGCAERVVGVFLDAAVNMARFINEYKTKQVAPRIAEIETADLTDPVIKKQALADIAKLTKYRDQLTKEVRWRLPQWELKVSK